MVYEEREYQIECEDALLQDVMSDPDCHPIAAIPTGGGKTKILSSFMYKYLEKNPYAKVVVISHTENILMQDHEAIRSFFPGINIGLYSSGLKSRTIEKITVAGIQSIYKKKAAKLFEDFDIAIVDECHTVPTKGNGMYQQFFQRVNVVRVGLSATIFRTGHGYVHRGKGAMFNKLSYDLCSMGKFNKLVDDGYLSKLFSKPPKLQLNSDGVRKSAGDFNAKALSERHDRDTITQAAVDETVEFGQNYKSWLVFAIDIKHANSINEKLLAKGIKSEVLHSETGHLRHEITDRFKSQETRCVVSVGMVTTGFDAPNIDLIVMLRPTMSPVLHVQMIGRGLRVCKWSGKTHCLVLDFAGNVARLGPINNVIVPTPGKKKKGLSEPIVKICPTCGCLHHPTVKICDVCNHKFVFKEKIKTRYSTDDVVQTTKEAWVRVSAVEYKIHRKLGSPDTLRVFYKCGLRTFNEFVCFDHPGKVKHFASHWVKMRWTLMSKFPKTVQDLHKNSHLLRAPKKILVDTSHRYPIIKDFIL